MLKPWNYNLFHNQTNKNYTSSRTIYYWILTANKIPIKTMCLRKITQFYKVQSNSLSEKSFWHMSFTFQCQPYVWCYRWRCGRHVLLLVFLPTAYQSFTWPVDAIGCLLYKNVNVLGFAWNSDLCHVAVHIQLSHGPNTLTMACSSYLSWSTPL